ncbi:MAG: glutamine synthetase III [Clostridia bacterium]|nr:glutamine synthetase III [Clostridia bacterium]
MSKVTEIFASNVFNDDVMRQRLPEEVYKGLQWTAKHGHHLDISIANAVATAMKEWAMEKGATHFTHWFQPMTGITAEKHDSFISPAGDGRIIMEFSGKELIKGESDASSFPNGGLRATFEARGYTAWDPTSYAFIKDDVLCIPTAFCSYGGQALDKKTPLLRSMEAINRQAMRVLKLFGSDAEKINTTVGPEQEYFLIPKELFDKRKDLIYTGRTLFGAMPSKGQELDDHYFGSIKPAVHAFMKDLDVELWKLGVLAKTEHNEGAPAQHELAPVFTTTNIAADHNQLTMEMMQKIAREHGLECLLHEKPFEGVSGSGKHNNWSLCTDKGVNLLDPGKTPSENAQFLLFLCAVIKAVHEYQELLRISIASAGNDHRLGGGEAPPAIVSMFLGDELSGILDAIENGNTYDQKEKEQLKIGVHVLPRFPKDTTDRNRTSPFAFTGNKFEFRMLGASASVSEVNVVINTAVAESLKQFADRLENAEDFETELNELIRETISKHKNIIFNGNGYDDAWIAEAEKRGLKNLKTTPDALKHYVTDKNVELFVSHKVYSREEMESRLEIMLDNYNKLINIEARTMINMASKDILPAVSEYSKKLADTAISKRTFSKDIPVIYEEENLVKISTLAQSAYETLKKLRVAVEDVKAIKENGLRADFCKNTVLPLMKDLRKDVDELETVVSSDMWPYPSIGELLFGVR